MDKETERKEMPQEEKEELGWKVTEEELDRALEKVANGFEW